MGVKYSSNEVSVATGGTLILSANPARSYLFIQNKGVNNVHLSFGGQGGVNEGVRIGPGEIYEPKAPANAEIFGRSTTLASTVVAIEGQGE